MRGWLKAFVLCAALASLSACARVNQVRSEVPLFVGDDAHPAPALKAGVWASVQPGCAFDPARPVRRWPECAQAEILGQDPFDNGPGLKGMVGQSRLVAGDPLINQSWNPAVEKQPAYYSYQALRPTGLDRAGRVTAYETWEVTCGPQPPQTELAAAAADGSAETPAADDILRVTQAPFPGLRVAGDVCYAEDAETLRGAARASHAWETVRRLTWVRGVRFRDNFGRRVAEDTHSG